MVRRLRPLFRYHFRSIATSFKDMRVNVPTSELKVGDVIEHVAGYGVVTSISKNTKGIDEIAVLYLNEAISFWPRTNSEFLHSRVAEGCDTNREAVKKFVDGLIASASAAKPVSRLP